jgi:hypothetical protein
MSPLFDDCVRTDGSESGHLEDVFSFLNRADGPVWRRIRETLDAWYGEFPDRNGDLRQRFRSPNPRQHYPAWWELYVHKLMRSLGYAVTVHPTIDGVAGQPDFLVERPGESLYVEAATVFSGIVAPERNQRLDAVILDALDSIPAPDLMMRLEITRRGRSTPRRRDITEPVEAWLASSVDADELLADGSHQGQPQRFAFGDWEIELQPIARSLQFRGCPDNKLLATHGGVAGYTDDASKLRAAVTRKGKKYGKPDKPLLVAVLAANGFVDDEEIANALFGSIAVQLDLKTGAHRTIRQPDGVWIGKRGPKAKRVSAVLLGVAIMPHSCATAWPRLWHHFDADRPLEARLPFPSVIVDDGELQFEDGSRTAAEVLGLPADWPGPEPPFVGCQHRPGDHAASLPA